MAVLTSIKPRPSMTSEAPSGTIGRLPPVWGRVPGLEELVTTEGETVAPGLVWAGLVTTEGDTEGPSQAGG